jgi:hypothetical protein
MVVMVWTALSRGDGAKAPFVVWPTSLKNLRIPEPLGQLPGITW